MIEFITTAFTRIVEEEIHYPYQYLDSKLVREELPGEMIMEAFWGSK
jgi:hypothetical protein